MVLPATNSSQACLAPKEEWLEILLKYGCLINQEENSFTKIPIVHTDRWLSPRCAPLTAHRALCEASLFFERSSCICQPSSETRQKLSELPVHRGSQHFSCLFRPSKQSQKKQRFIPLTFVLIGDRSPSILVEFSCQLLASPSYSLPVQSLSIPHEKSHVGKRPLLPSPGRRLGTATLSNLNPQCLKSALFLEKPAPLLALFPLSLFLSCALSLLPLSPPSLSIICLQLSVYHAHLTNDPCLRYHIWAKKSDPDQTAGAAHTGPEARGLSSTRVCSCALSLADSWRHSFLGSFILLRNWDLTAVDPVATITQMVFWFNCRKLKKKSHLLDVSKYPLFNPVWT